MSKLYIYYNKCLTETGRPIMVSNGKSAINCDSVFLENVCGELIFDNAKGDAKKSGVRAALEIEIKE